ncbi:MAG: hypothetical protein O2931_12770 [Planctomycetota bacterium]|nr:hypothetical protein [Planctomycetota bacterium]MDA1179658.1 hypothetical protein [Planctomycetota bacterium]
MSRLAMTRLRAFSVAMLVAISTLSTTASAQSGGFDGCYGNFMGGGFPGIAGYGANLLPYSLGHVPVPPYFAIHPPVYYSAPVPRTYGYSPYAYPGSFRTPEIEVPTPAMIENPHVKPSVREKPVNLTASVDSTATDSSQVILNPYVRQAVAVR